MMTPQTIRTMEGEPWKEEPTPIAALATLSPAEGSIISKLKKMIATLAP
jgi:hypothetical protein